MFDYLEWQRKTCGHTIGLIRDEQMLKRILTEFT